MSLDPRYLATGVDAALEAGRIHRRYFRQHPDIHKKGRIDLVTNADLEAERMFRDLIAQRFPDHVVVGEEAGAVASPEGRCRWIIDPVDGTTNFAHGLALFCVSIALEIDGRLALGVVYDPINEELFTAERGEGARLNGEPIHVSSCAELVDGLLVTGFPYTIREERRRQVDVFAAFLHEAQAVRRLGSAALDLCYVAAGRLDGYWEERVFPWDIAAGALLVAEAGGTVTGLDNQPFDPFGLQILATNGPLHEPMLEVIRRVHEERA
ncbi:MAG TPA: inositol monophosphatase family protein [Vicinamibacterales bacterium]|nr:inositol monophosphatase family protein [Vicinamibacterales bacterium]